MKRCAFPSCRVKLSLSGIFWCRCGMDFCAKHRLPEDHVCSFDFKATGLKQLEEQLVKVVAQKISSI